MQQGASTTLDAVLDNMKSLVGQLLAAPRVAISDIPERPGVYLIYDMNWAIMYVGKGKDLHRRITLTTAEAIVTCLRARFVGK
jgi:hypothetical protein